MLHYFRRGLCQVFIIFTVFIFLAPAYAEERGAYWKYEHIGGDSYVITLNILDDCSSPSISSSTTYSYHAFSQCGYPNLTYLDLDWAGVDTISNYCSSVITDCTTGSLAGLLLHSFKDTVQLQPCQSWVIWTRYLVGGLVYQNADPNNSVYVGMEFNNSDLDIGRSSYPSGMNSPLACSSITNFEDLEFENPDNDSVRFEFTPAFRNFNDTMVYLVSNVPEEPVPGMTLDSLTGTMEIPPANVGRYISSIQIKEYKEGTLISRSDVVFEVLLENNCWFHQPPTSSGISNVSGALSSTSTSITACASSNVCFDLTVTDNFGSGQLQMTETSSLYFDNVSLSSSVSGGNMTYSMCIPPQNLSAGTYPIDFVVVDDGCDKGKSARFRVDYVIQDGKMDVGDDTYYCGAPATLNQDGIPGNINWSTISGDPIVVGSNFSCNNCSSPEATPATSTQYVGSYVDACGNTLTDTVKVEVTNQVTVQVPDSVLQCGSFTVDPVNSGLIDNYQWLDSNGVLLSSDTAFTNVGLSRGLHEITVVVTTGGCSDTDVVFIANNMFSLTMVTEDTILCGSNTTELSAHTFLDYMWIDNFDNGVNQALWDTIYDGYVDAADCGTRLGTGTALKFDGSTNVRRAVTVPLNTTLATEISYCLFLGNTYSTPYCENMDNTEDVYVEYSNNGGTSWNLIQVYASNDWDTGGPYFNAWTCFNEPLPAGAIGPSVIFRVHSPSFSMCAGCDNWALDDFGIRGTGAGPIYYDWTGSNLVDQVTTSSTISNVSSGWSYVSVTDSASGCTLIDSVEIHPSGPLDVEITVSSDTICLGSNTGYAVSPNTSNCDQCAYTWSTGDVGVSYISHSPTPNDSIWVVVSDASSGCTGRDTAVVEVDSVSASISPSIRTVCDPDSAVLEATINAAFPLSFYDIVWTDASTNSTMTIVGDTICILDPVGNTGTIELSVDASTFGCMSTASATVVRYPQPDTTTAGYISGPTSVSTNTAYTYEWLGASDWISPYWNVTGGSIVSGQNQSQISVMWGSGSYGTVSVTVDDDNSCGVEHAITLPVFIFVSVEEVMVDFVDVYPNPASHKLTIEGLDNLESEEPLQILDVTGRQVLTIDPNADRVTVDVSSLETGMYTVVTADRTSLTRFVVSR